MSVRVCNRIRMTKKSNLFTGFAQGTHIVVLFETMYLHTAFPNLYGKRKTSDSRRVSQNRKYADKKCPDEFLSRLKLA